MSASQHWAPTLQADMIVQEENPAIEVGTMHLPATQTECAAAALGLPDPSPEVPAVQDLTSDFAAASVRLGTSIDILVQSDKPLQIQTDPTYTSGEGEAMIAVRLDTGVWDCLVVTPFPPRHHTHS